MPRSPRLAARDPGGLANQVRRPLGQSIPVCAGLAQVAALMTRMRLIKSLSLSLVIESGVLEAGRDVGMGCGDAAFPEPNSAWGFWPKFEGK